MTCEEYYGNLALQFNLFEQSVWYTIALLGIFAGGLIVGWIARGRRRK